MDCDVPESQNQHLTQPPRRSPVNQPLCPECLRSPQACRCTRTPSEPPIGVTEEAER